MIPPLIFGKSYCGFFIMAIKPSKVAGTIHVVYFQKALGTRTSKMMILGVKYRNVQNLIYFNFKFWDLLGGGPTGP